MVECDHAPSPLPPSITLLFLYVIKLLFHTIYICVMNFSSLGCCFYRNGKTQTLILGEQEPCSLMMWTILHEQPVSHVTDDEKHSYHTTNF